jgi:hypothetical protein
MFVSQATNLNLALDKDSMAKNSYLVTEFLWRQIACILENTDDRESTYVIFEFIGCKETD